MQSIPKTSGIYQIRNILNNKLYIGSAVNLKHRWQTHLLELSKGEHHSIKLQRAYNKYGAESFTFEVLELVEDKNNLITREQYYIDKFNVVNEGYNICPIAGSSLGRHLPNPTYVRKVVCLETGQIYNSIREASNYKLSLASNITQACKSGKLAGGLHWMYLEGYQNTDAKLIQDKLNKKLKKLVLCIELNKVFEGTQEAAKYVGLKSRSGIVECCNGKRLTAGEYHWKYINP